MYEKFDLILYSLICIISKNMQDFKIGKSDSYVIWIYFIIPITIVYWLKILTNNEYFYFTLGRNKQRSMKDLALHNVVIWFFFSISMIIESRFLLVQLKRKEYKDKTGNPDWKI